MQLSNVTSCWSRREESFTLRHIDLKIMASQRIGVIGPVGAGKSSLMMTLIKVLPLRKWIHSPIAYLTWLPTSLVNSLIRISRQRGHLVPLPTLSLIRLIRSRQPGQVGNRGVTRKLIGRLPVN